MVGSLIGEGTGGHSSYRITGRGTDGHSRKRHEAKKANSCCRCHGVSTTQKGDFVVGTAMEY